jgi:hypothetical protein
MIRFACLPILALAAWPAAADVTPEQVWDHWQQLATSFDATLAARSVARDGDTLVLQGVSLTTPSMANTPVAPIAWIRLQDRGNGTVRVTAVPRHRMALTGQAGDGAPFAVTVDMAADALETLVVGDAARLDHVITADRLQLSLAMPPDDQMRNARVDLGLDGAVFSFVSDLGGSFGASLAGDGGVAQAEIGFRGTAADGSVYALRAEHRPMRVTYGVAPVLPGDSLLPTAFAARIGVMAERGALDLRATDPTGDALSVTGQTGGVRLDASTEDGRIAYGWMAADLRSEIGVTGLRDPYVIALAETSGNIDIPIGALDRPDPFRLAFGWRNLDLGSAIWRRIDPEGALDHGPLTLALDLSGTMRWTSDIFGTPAAPTATDDLPFAVDELRVATVEIAGGGATITGSGDLTLDTAAVADLGQGGTSLQRPPVYGRVELAGQGIAGLLDALDAHGGAAALAASARSIIGLIAVPGRGDDTLVSEIEITPEGKAVANGTPLN